MNDVKHKDLDYDAQNHHDISWKHHTQHWLMEHDLQSPNHAQDVVHPVLEGLIDQKGDD